MCVMYYIVVRMVIAQFFVSRVHAHKMRRKKATHIIAPSFSISFLVSFARI